jgi:hypothetical protein
MNESPGPIDEISDPAVLAVMSEAIGLASSMLGIKRPPMPRLLWHEGELAETRHLPTATQVLFVRGSNSYQVMRQAGHEAVHVVVGTNESYWTHEMVAEVMSLEFIERKRQFIYLAQTRAELARQASVEESGLTRPYNFGKCYQAGIELLAVVKRHQLLALGRHPPSDSGLEQWLADLPPETAARVRAIVSRVTAQEAASAPSPDTGEATASDGEVLGPP